jgi:hypothetical protein
MNRQQWKSVPGEMKYDSPFGGLATMVSLAYDPSNNMGGISGN